MERTVFISDVIKEAVFDDIEVQLKFDELLDGYVHEIISELHDDCGDDVEILLEDINEFAEHFDNDNVLYYYLDNNMNLFVSFSNIVDDVESILDKVAIYLLKNIFDEVEGIVAKILSTRTR